MLSFSIFKKERTIKTLLLVGWLLIASSATDTVIASIPNAIKSSKPMRDKAIPEIHNFCFDFLSSKSYPNLIESGTLIRQYVLIHVL